MLGPSEIRSYQLHLIERAVEGIRCLFRPTILTLFVCFPPQVAAPDTVRKSIGPALTETDPSRRGDIETESGIHTCPAVALGTLTDCFGNLNQRVTHNPAFSAGKLARGQHNGAARWGAVMFEFLEFFARGGMTRAGLGPA
jgi:hypothetical protein